MFYEAMEDVLPSLKVIIESPNGDVQTFYPIESFANFENVQSNDTSNAAAE